MKKSTLLIILLLAGWGFIGRSSVYLTGYNLICVKETNVYYVQSASGTAPLVNRAGHPVACGE